MSIDNHTLDGPLVPQTPEDRQTARLSCAVCATDAAELRMFLDALDLKETP